MIITNYISSLRECLQRHQLHVTSWLLPASLFLLCFLQCNVVQEPRIPIPAHSAFQKLNIEDIEPRGWIKKFMDRQVSGLSGNIEVAGYPFNTCGWGCERIEGSTKVWWPYEQIAYYLDGIHRLGHLLDDEQLLTKAHSQMEYVMAHTDSSGRIGTSLQDRWWRWPYAPFLRNFMTEYSLSGDLRYLEMMKRHYRTFEAADFADDLELANIEELCWLYSITKDQNFLQKAEEAYELFNSNISFRNRAGSDIRFASDRIPDHHGVVYLELVKIPAILYSHTGNKEYLDQAVHGISKMEKYHMLVSGLPSSTEHFEGISETSGVETCNVAVLPHTYGYMLRISGNPVYADKIEKAVFNGALGSITKDFKAHQYFSSPNQFITTHNSNPYGHHPSRMAYLPGHDVECCTGNVNRFMPYFVEQMWFTSPSGEVVSSLFGPSSVVVRVGESNKRVIITEETIYPFSESIQYQIQTAGEVKFPFLIRIPAWCSNPRVEINGTKVADEVKQGTFYKLERTFSDGDLVTLTLPMQPEITSWPNNGMSIQRGPLVYSLPIKEVANIVQNYDRSTSEFPGWEFRPVSAWNYALIPDSGGIEVVQVDNHQGYPWDKENTPVTLRVQARKVLNWQLEKVFDKDWGTEVVRTSGFPEHLELDDDIEYLELVPYGSTVLRTTVFPKIELE